MADETKEKTKPPRQTCGIVMPISSIDGCTEEHWSDVLGILTDAIDGCGYAPNLVSNADDIGIIQKRIIQNLYDNPLVVCDVSGKNPNVMFELGIRLAFDKPTIIVKDDKTQYSFDTAPIEHVTYPRDLRFGRIVEFKESLSDKIKGTAKAAQSDPKYTTFLKHFGTFQVAKLESKEVSGEKLILEELAELRSSLRHSRVRDRDRQRTNTDFGSLIKRTRLEMKKLCQKNGWRSKLKIRESKEVFRAHVQEAITAPMHFQSKSAFDDFFDSIFDAIYPS